MRTVDCLYIIPPGEVWIRFMDGETRKATENEERLVFQIDPAAASEIRWQKSPPRLSQKALSLAI